MPHALIVDDDALTRETLTEIAAAEGFTTSAGASLREARIQIARQRPDVAIVDLKLPDGDGMELFDEREPGGPFAIVVMTGDARVDTAVEAMRRGAADYLVKPVDVARVKALLARTIERADTLADTVLDVTVPGAPATAAVAAPAPLPAAINAITVPLGTSLDDADRALILATLEYCGGVRKRAADLLGISLKTLYNRLVAYRGKGGNGHGQHGMRGGAREGREGAGAEPRPR